MSAVLATAYAAIFVALCVLCLRATSRRDPLWVSIGVLGLCTLFFYLVFPGIRFGAGPDALTIPGLAMVAMDRSAPLPVPAFAFWSYLALVVVGILAVVTASDDTFKAFMDPIVRLLAGPKPPPESAEPAAIAGFRRARALRAAALYGVVPLLCGWLAFDIYRPSTAVPAQGRLAHPSISYDEKLKNPLRSPSKARLAAFARKNKLGKLPAKKLRARFTAAMVHEGRHLYAKSCAPCHGGKADGAGPMARAQRLAPANFTDPGTIGTLVEAYAFERVANGGVGLPSSGTPWDSAMPRWKGDLTKEQMFKVLLAAYDLAGVEPRVPEKLE